MPRTLEPLCMITRVLEPLRQLLPRLLSYTVLEQLANIPCHTDPFAEADEDTGETKQSQNYIHIRIQRRYIPELGYAAAQPRTQKISS